MTHHLDLDTLTLKSGGHPTPDDGLCVMEAVAYFAHEAHSAHPACASPVITVFAMSLNDRWDDTQRQKLVPLIPAIAGTRTTKEDDQTRAWMATDWLVRTYTPAWLRLAGLNDQADLLVALGPLTGPETVPPIKSTLEAVRKDAAAAWAAAWDAAGDAAWDAAGAAAWDAAGDAAWDAAWDAAGAAARDAARAAARDAARAAAWAAAWDAAGAALAPTVATLQDSALDLLTRMCAVGGES